jgi:hypothetical protein
MDEAKPALPAWLPWATTACLAALVACLGELLIIERARDRLLREESVLAETAMKGMENQLEAERILSSRQLADARPRPQEEIQVVLLGPPEGLAPSADGPAMGVVIWDPAGQRGLIRLSGGTGQDPGRDYQLWIEGPGARYPASCGVFHAPQDDEAAAVPIEVGAPVASGCRFVLIDGARGGAATLAEAQAGGSIVLASLPPTGKITSR